MAPLINQLFKKYLDGKCSPQEKEMLLDHFRLADNESLLKELIIQELQATEAPESLVPDLDNRLNRVYGQVSLFMDHHTAKPSFWRRSWRSASAAAAAAILVIGSVILYKFYHTEHDIRPGKNAATLILANGEKIILSDAGNGNIAKQAGVTITKTAGGQLVYELTPDASQTDNRAAAYNTLSTANGEQYKVVLPDGSSVILNAASRIRFPVSFVQLNERKIQLEGEAYFSVKHNAKQPFRVVARGQMVEDIGTEFNISAYADDPDIKTTVAEGIARVIPEKTASLHNSVVLTASQQSILTNGRLQVQSVDLRLALAWKNGKFSFKNTSLDEAMKQVARWYNIKVVYETPGLKMKRLSGSVSRYDKVSGILEAIEYTTEVKFKIEGSTITVMKDTQDN